MSRQTTAVHAARRAAHAARSVVQPPYLERRADGAPEPARLAPHGRCAPQRRRQGSDKALGPNLRTAGVLPVATKSDSSLMRGAGAPGVSRQRERHGNAGANAHVVVRMSCVVPGRIEVPLPTVAMITMSVSPRAALHLLFIFCASQSFAPHPPRPHTHTRTPSKKER